MVNMKDIQLLFTLKKKKEDILNAKLIDKKG